jgi:hypothetical protein
MTQSESGGTTTALTRSDIAGLVDEVAGAVLLPGDDGYAEECATFNLLTPVRPAVVVAVTSVGDVQAAVGFAAERGLPIGVLTAGHEVVDAGEGAVLVSTSRLDDVTISPDSRIARVGGGVRAARVIQAAAEYGLTPVTGAAPTVGVVGFNLGGGHSPILGRTHGYAADHVVAVELVTAEGGFRRVTAETDEELFWALRGGKGNFGVVTALEYRLFPLEQYYGGGLFFSGEDAATVLHAWRDWAFMLPAEFSTSIAFLRLPDVPVFPPPLRGRFAVHVRFSSLLGPLESDRFLDFMRDVAPVTMDTVRLTPFTEAATLHMDPASPGPMTETSVALREFPHDAVDAVLDVMGTDSATHLGFMEIRVLGGALGREQSAPNAVSGRGAQWALVAAGNGGPDMTAVFCAELDELRRAVLPWAQDEIMANLLGPEQARDAAGMRAAYGPFRYRRLLAVKQRVDPGNLFRLNHNIAAD